MYFHGGYFISVSYQQIFMVFIFSSGWIGITISNCCGMGRKWNKWKLELFRKRKLPSTSRNGKPRRPNHFCLGQNKLTCAKRRQKTSYRCRLNFPTISWIFNVSFRAEKAERSINSFSTNLQLSSHWAFSQLFFLYSW